MYTLTQELNKPIRKKLNDYYQFIKENSNKSYIEKEKNGAKFLNIEQYRLLLECKSDFQKEVNICRSYLNEIKRGL